MVIKLNKLKLFAVVFFLLQNVFVIAQNSCRVIYKLVGDSFYRSPRSILVFNDTMAFSFSDIGLSEDGKGNIGYGEDWRPAHVLYAMADGRMFSRNACSTKRKPRLVELNRPSVTWKLLNEEKIISGYKCRKAISENAYWYAQPANVTVWYTTQLGSVNVFSTPYGTFPGLVLELEDDTKQQHFIVEKIEYGNFKIGFPNNAKVSNKMDCLPFYLKYKL